MDSDLKLNVKKILQKHGIQFKRLPKSGIYRRYDVYIAEATTPSISLIVEPWEKDVYECFHNVALACFFAKAAGNSVTKFIRDCGPRNLLNEVTPPKDHMRQGQKFFDDFPKHFGFSLTELAFP